MDRRRGVSFSSVNWGDLAFKFERSAQLSRSIHDAFSEPRLLANSWGTWLEVPTEGDITRYTVRNRCILHIIPYGARTYITIQKATCPFGIIIEAFCGQSSRQNRGRAGMESEWDDRFVYGEISFSSKHTTLSVLSEKRASGSVVVIWMD